MIEILVVVGIFILLAGLGLFATLDSYRGYSFRSERDIVVNLLEKARNQSMSNVDQSPHGFCVEGSNYVVFEGSDCTTGTKKETTPTGSGVTLTPALPAAGVSFTQLSGDSSWVGSLTLSQNSKSAVISVNSEGMIDW